ncbi:hypothetical protein CF54_04810 [Streptomyces sp. Tu 6176]|nr:hypothetical protein CF54_04810 [Streptomyces sp. Tu 6176]
MRAGGSEGHASIQHGPAGGRLVPRDGPRVHRRMQSHLVTADDARAPAGGDAGGEREEQS